VGTTLLRAKSASLSRSALLGVGYMDALPEALSAIYFYYGAEGRSRSLGTFHVLSMIASAQERGLLHAYLGYYVAGCRSLEYKARYRPNEVEGGRRVGGICQVVTRPEQCPEETSPAASPRARGGPIAHPEGLGERNSRNSRNISLRLNSPGGPAPRPSRHLAGSRRPRPSAVSGERGSGRSFAQPPRPR
jgi:hypothetical protein